MISRNVNAVFEEHLSIAANEAVKIHTYRLGSSDFPHYHRTIEFGVCIKGGGQSETDSIRQNFSAGDFQIVFPFQVHRNICAPNSECVWKWSFIDIIEIARATGNNIVVFIELMKKIPIYGIISPSVSPKLSAYLGELIDTVETRSDYYLEKTHALLMLVFTSLLTLSAGSPSRPVELPERFETLITALYTINKNILNRRLMTVQELSDCCLIPISTCRRIFDKNIGMSPKKYILTCAIQYAKTYLVTTEQRITEIADATGFSEITTFNRVFRDVTGCSPSEYRKLNSQRF